jgi:hypothetical protein
MACQLTTSLCVGSTFFFFFFDVTRGSQFKQMVLGAKVALHSQTTFPSGLFDHKLNLYIFYLIILTNVIN